MNSSKKVLIGTIQLSLGFTVRPFPFFLFEREAPRLPLHEQSRGDGGEDGSGSTGLGQRGPATSGAHPWACLAQPEAG